jgi:hypothetical protein
MLVQTSQTTSGLAARQIRFAPGVAIERPVISLAGLIIISILLFIQLIGLGYLGWYIYQVPTWTGLLDAMAIARIANSLDKGAIPGIGSVTREDMNKLGKTNGLIGVIDTVHLDEEADDPLEKKEIELGLGAPGVFNRRLAKVAMQRAKRRRTMEKEHTTEKERTMEKECTCSGCRMRRLDGIAGINTVSTDGSDETRVAGSMEIIPVRSREEGHGRG